MASTRALAKDSSSCANASSDSCITTENSAGSFKAYRLNTSQQAHVRKASKYLTASRYGLRPRKGKNRRRISCFKGHPVRHRLSIGQSVTSEKHERRTCCTVGPAPDSRAKPSMNLEIIDWSVFATCCRKCHSIAFSSRICRSEQAYL